MKRTLAVDRLAHEIARDDSIATIDSMCVSVTGHGTSPPWYDAKDTCSGGRPFVDRAVRYLELRKLLDRDPKQPHLVRIRTRPRQGGRQ